MPTHKLLTFLAGAISGLIFAPIFFMPGLLALPILCYQIQKSLSLHQAYLIGLIFGFGHFLSSMYWISIGVTVYIDEFWWVIPFALFGIPLILAFFIGGACALSWKMRKHNYYHLIFCVSWVFFEVVRSWIFTGLPWNLLGDSLSFSCLLIQPASVVGIYGLSFMVIYISTVLSFALTRQYHQLKISSLTSCIIIVAASSYSIFKLQQHPTVFSNIKVRLVQPSIPQVAKWEPAAFWHNLGSHITLSERPGSPDLIIWSEAALVAPYTFMPLQSKLLHMLRNIGGTLITGGVKEEGPAGLEPKIYSTMYAIDASGQLLFEYYKSHLVPFGEYIPLKDILPMKKLTPGFLDYTQGDGQLVRLDKLNLTIRALICYESIFSGQVRTSNTSADVIINITNDAWYGNSSGPYQHFYISRMRAVENGLPMLRVGNNGITAVIDPVGRIIQKLGLNQIGVIDNHLPLKLECQTLYSNLGYIGPLALMLIVLLIQSVIGFILKRLSHNALNA